MTTHRRAVVLALLVALWIWGAYQTRDVDSDWPTSSPGADAGEGSAPGEQAWTGPAVGSGAPEAGRESVSGARASRSRRPEPRGSLTDTTCYVWTGNRTASGTWPKVGDAASNRYPFGTVLQVEHVGRVVVRDRIGHSSELDLFFTSRAACIKFGRQQLHVRVVR